MDHSPLNPGERVMLRERLDRLHRARRKDDSTRIARVESDLSAFLRKYYRNRIIGYLGLAWIVDDDTPPGRVRTAPRLDLD